MNYVYLVKYCTGAYDDYVSRPVQAFLEWPRAIELANVLNNRLKEEHLHRDGPDFIMNYDKADRLMREFEQTYNLTASISYTGANFIVTAVPLGG